MAAGFKAFVITQLLSLNPRPESANSCVPEAFLKGACL